MTIKFHDVSHYQGNYHPNGPTIAKATEGSTYTDAAYKNNRDRTLAGGWPFAAYHYLRPGNVKAQAVHCHNVVGQVPCMLDVERSTAGNASYTDVLTFIDEYRRLGGVMYLVYLPHWYWQGTWHSPNLQKLKDRKMSLISSNYTTYSDSGPGWSSYGGMSPKIWQFTSTPIDTNAFKGTQAALGALFKGTGTPAPTPNPVYLIGPYPGVVLKLGSVGNNVAKIQKKLNLNGYPLVADGAFGTKTDAAVRLFQSRHGLTVDGLVGPLTWAAIGRLPK